MDDWFALYDQAITVLIYLAIGVYFVKAQNNDERFHFLLVVAGFFILGDFIGNAFLAQFFFAAWLALMDVPMMIPRNYVLVALAAAAVLRVYSSGFIAISALLYVIVMWGFLWGAVKKAGNLAN